MNIMAVTPCISRLKEASDSLKINDNMALANAIEYSQIQSDKRKR